MTIQNEHVNVLLVGTPLAKVAEIEKQLERIINLDCHLSESPDINIFLKQIDKQILGIDVILLDLAWADSSDSEHFFKTIQKSAPELQIIVFTREEDRPLALFMLKKGASEVRSSSGNLDIKPNRLGDLIEDSWARHKNSKERMEESASALRKEQKLSASHLKEERTKSAEVIKEEKEKGAEKLKEEKEKAGEKLKEEKEKGAEKLKEKDQVISWMSGAYSLEKLSD